MPPPPPPPPISPSAPSLSPCSGLFKRPRFPTDVAAASTLSHLPGLNDDIWSTIFSLLDLSSIVQLALVNRAFHHLVMERCKWRMACIRDLNVPFDARPQFSWRDLYRSAIGKLHSFSFHQSHRHLDWLRVGSFQVESGDVLVSSNLSEFASSSTSGATSEESSTFRVSNLMEGAWIADLHLLRCSICNQPLCQGTMQMLEARYWELFLHEQYIKGEWKFEKINEQLAHPSLPSAAMAAIIDAKHAESESTQELLQFEKWTYPEDVYLPSTICNKFAAAASTNLGPENEGMLVIRLYTMRATKQAPIIAIRMTQELEIGPAEETLAS